MTPTTPSTTPDLQSMTDQALMDLALAVNTEQNRRATIAQAPAQIDQAVKEYQDAAGTARKDGAAWVQPTGALDAYPLGATVTLGGRTYESLIPANVWQPGNKADPQTGRWWKDTTPSTGSSSTAPAGAVPAWDGNGHAYKVGEKVTYQGKTYKVLQAHTSQSTWTPTVVPSLYQEVAA